MPQGFSLRERLWKNREESSQYKSDVLEAMLWSDRYITFDNDHACANYKSIANLHSQCTDELVVEALNKMLQLVESLENLAGLGPPPGSDYLTGTRGGSPLHRATGRMTFDVHGHIRIKRVRGIVHVGRSMSVSTNCVWHHARMDCVVPYRTCACNTCLLLEQRATPGSTLKRASLRPARVCGIRST